MSNRSIPLVDLSSFVNGDEAQKQAFVEALGKAFHEVGFVGVINHQVPKDLIDGFYASSKAFFSLPVDVKRKYEIAGLAGQRGYTSYGKEHAKQSAVADLKEFYQIGQYVSDDHSLKHEYPTNPTVTEIEVFQTIARNYTRPSKGQEPICCAPLPFIWVWMRPVLRKKSKTVTASCAPFTTPQLRKNLVLPSGPNNMKTSTSSPFWWALRREDFNC
jgi:hypothetical protein